MPASDPTPSRSPLRCYTRALKNARHLKRYAPRLFEEAGREGFGTGLPIELLCVYCSHEHAVERLVRSAWTDRTVITVFALRRRPDHPVAIMLRRAPEPFQH